MTCMEIRLQVFFSHTLTFDKNSGGGLNVSQLADSHTGEVLRLFDVGQSEDILADGGGGRVVEHHYNKI